MKDRPDTQTRVSTSSSPVDAAQTSPDAGDDDGPGATLTWSVGAVSSRLDITPSTLRTWERRYGVGPSHRTQGGHRRYTERDIERVELVRRLVGRGVSAQDAARVARNLDHDELLTALADETQDQRPVGRLELIDAFLSATTSNDGSRLKDLVDGVVDRSRFLDAWTQLLAPALMRMAHESAVGSLDVEAERLANDVILGSMLEVRSRGARAPRPQVLLASGVDDGACLPIVALGAALVDADVTVRTVGPETDPRTVADLVEKLRPQVLIWWEQPVGTEEMLRRQLDRTGMNTFLLRAAPAWPKEIGLRFGFENPVVSTDVGGAVRHVLDRVT